MDLAPAREVRRLWDSARWQLKERGPKETMADAAHFAWSYVVYPVRKRSFEGETFEFAGRQLPYFRHHYNRAWTNERSVELALAFDFLERNDRGRILEVGHVLAHHGRGGHDVVDKYEQSPGVVNVDIVDFTPDARYDVIVSISTLEHVGFDERPREPDKTLRAYRRLREVLAPGGAMLLTCPMGYNPHLDEFIRDGRLDFPEIHYLRRVSKENHWAEVDLAEVKDARYGEPFRNANAVFVGIVPGLPATSATPDTG